MPAIPLGVRSASAFELIGEFGSVGSSISHVGLTAEPCIVRKDDPVPAIQMGPPLALSPPAMINNPSVLAWLPLSREEEEGLSAWLSDMSTRQQSCHYVALPSEERIFDPTSNRVTGWSFSCAGFVNAAYRDGASVQLLMNEEDLPDLSFESIQEIWSHLYEQVGQNEIKFRKLMRRYGICGPGPWKILAPGFLVHALNAGRGALPYSPIGSDINFP